MLTRNRRHHILILLIITLLGVFLVSCQTTPTPTADITTLTITPTQTQKPKLSPQTTLAPSKTLVPTDTPDEVDQNCCADYQIGLLGTPTTLNYWRYLGEDNSLWTKVVIGDEAPTLYEYPPLRSPHRIDFVPALAIDLPPQAEQRDDFWVIPVKLIEFAAWSDGEPLTAHDIVFTI